MTNRQLFLQHLAPTSPEPLLLEIEKGKGMYLYDVNGKCYMDLIAGISVSNLGHCHPAIVGAIQKQSEKYLHTMVYGEYILSPQVAFATSLAKHLPSSLNSTYFVNSGTEATEGAMKLAKRATGRPEIVSCRYAYHGSTQGAASLMSPTDFTQPYHPLLPGIKHIEYNCQNCLEKITEKTAAVIVETIQAEWGVRVPYPTYLTQLQYRCKEVGALLILDEIQVGFGRTGTLWAFEQFDIIPDILLLAKAMGGGMPIGAFVASHHLMQMLSNQPILGHITTFGGHPVSCAAALANLQVLTKENWIQQVHAKSIVFKQLLKHPAILEVRTAGLLVAVELGGFEHVQKVVRKCLEKGVIVDWFLFNNRSLRIAPPLIIDENQIEWACEQVLDAIEETYV